MKKWFVLGCALLFLPVLGLAVSSVGLGDATLYTDQVEPGAKNPLPPIEPEYFSVTDDNKAIPQTNTWLSGILWHDNNDAHNHRKDIPNAQQPVFAQPLAYSFVSSVGLGIFATDRFNLQKIDIPDAPANLQVNVTPEIMLNDSDSKNIKITKQTPFAAVLALFGVDIAVGRGSPFAQITTHDEKPVQFTMAANAKISQTSSFLDNQVRGILVTLPEMNGVINKYYVLYIDKEIKTVSVDNSIVTLMPAVKNAHVVVALLPSTTDGSALNDTSLQPIVTAAFSYIDNSNVIFSANGYSCSFIESPACEKTETSPSLVTTNFQLKTMNMISSDDNVQLLAVFPHQYQRNLPDSAKEPAVFSGQWLMQGDAALYYPSIRGDLKVAITDNVGEALNTVFSTTYRFPGILPYMPIDSKNADELRAQLHRFKEGAVGNACDHLAYYAPWIGCISFNGKNYLRMTADYYNFNLNLFALNTNGALAKTVDPDNFPLMLAAMYDAMHIYYPKPSDISVVSGFNQDNPFYYLAAPYVYYSDQYHALFPYYDGTAPNQGFQDDRWTLPAFFGYCIDYLMNDRLYNYGYQINNAALYTMLGGTSSAENMRKMRGSIDMLINDIAYLPGVITTENTIVPITYTDPGFTFPVMRQFDAYAGHGWATGNVNELLGNNEESISEAINTWAAIILYGDAVGNPQLVALGEYLYTTAMVADETYWMDTAGKTYSNPLFSEFKSTIQKSKFSNIAHVWGGQITTTTWFSSDPANTLRIVAENPMTNSTSLFITRYQDFIEKAQQSLPNDFINGMYPEDYLAFEAICIKCDGLNKAYAHWKLLSDKKTLGNGSHRGLADGGALILSLQAYGFPDFSYTSDSPLAMVFVTNDGKITLVAYNSSNKTKTVNFYHSDNSTPWKSVEVPANSMLNLPGMP